ncbi:MAG TPA: nitroreductase/quinone reductase family protein [Acidimicrobiales bacterium]|nr:nitroreductase/quinone reductase family protein [Acidimicrobiales bacterium]
MFVTFVGTQVAQWLSRHIGWRLDPYPLRLSGGRVGTGLMLPTALLETRGARTGQLRRNGVIYFHDGERVTIIASKLGLPEHPSWFHNAMAHPDVVLGGHGTGPKSSVTSPPEPGSGISPTGSSRRMLPTA